MKISFSILFLITLAVPAALELLVPQWNVSLGGVTKKKEIPELSWSNFSNGKYQARFEKWFMRQLGVRPFLIKTDNQINYEIFSQLSSSRKGKAVLGKHNHLIEKIYLKRAQGALTPSKRNLEAKAKEIRRIHKILQKHNIPLVILISPNKPSFYPETIPWSYQVSKHAIGKYDPLPYFSSLLTEWNIPVIVSKTIFQKQKDNFSHPFFAHTGTHWSELGSCLIASELFSNMTNLLPPFSGKLKCKVDGDRKFPLPIDRDLLSVANLWTPKRLVRTAPKVVREVRKSQTRPSLLFVGTSYLWALFYNIDKTKLLSKRDMYYYFKRSVPYPSGKERLLDRKDSRWIKRALKHDMIILEVNEAFLHRLGYGFPKQLLKFTKQLAGQHR